MEHLCQNIKDQIHSSSNIIEEHHYAAVFKTGSKKKCFKRVS